MSTITISAGTKEGAYLEDDGGFAATLVGFERRGPYPAKQPKYEGEEFYMNDWVFAIEGAPQEACLVWHSTGESTGPKSKTFAVITALFGGNKPPVGFKVDIETQLIGRMALVNVRKNAEGYMDVESVVPLPKAMQKAAPAAPPKASPARAAVADAESGDESLPF